MIIDVSSCGGHDFERATMRCTVPALTPNRSAILRTPSLQRSFRASRMRCSNSGAIGVRPSLPSLLARASPARTRSWIIERSNSANTPII
jgi:hypothetical protein